MLDLLPCPFCGSGDLLTEDGDKFVMCADASCAGHDAWHRTTHWQNRKKPDDDQLKMAYAQFEASLKVEREKSRLSKTEIEIIELADYFCDTVWAADEILQETADVLNSTAKLVGKYKKEKA